MSNELSLFDMVEKKETMSSQAAISKKQKSAVKITVTEGRITNSFSISHLEKAGISSNDYIDLIYSLDGMYMIISAGCHGFKLQKVTPQSASLSVRLTNNKETYPDFIGIHGGENSTRVVLKSGDVQYDKKKKRMAVSLIKA